MQKKPQSTQPYKELDEFILAGESKGTTELKTHTKVTKRQTYYITETLIEALRHMAYHKGMDKSEIVRKALSEYIPEEYIRMAEEK